MKYLLDVNVLIAGIIATHPHHARVEAWLEDKSVLVCPLSELGFLRISTNPRALGFTMRDARQLLENFIGVNNAKRIPADLAALESHPKKSEDVTDHYLGDLAARHNLKLATLDSDLSHPAAELVS